MSGPNRAIRGRSLRTAYLYLSPDPLDGVPDPERPKAKNARKPRPPRKRVEKKDEDRWPAKA